MCGWILTFICFFICLFDSVAKVVAPKREALCGAEEQLSVAMTDLEVKRASLWEVQDKLDKLETQLETHRCRKLDLENQVSRILIMFWTQSSHLFSRRCNITVLGLACLTFLFRIMTIIYPIVL